MRKVIAATLLAMAILTVGCSEEEPTSGQQDGGRRTGAAQDQAQAGGEKPKTVVVNEGMSEKEEDELNQRLAELEEQVDDQPTSQPTQVPESSGESEALAAAQSYYAAAAAGDYVQTYNELSAFSQVLFTEGEWVAANTALQSDSASYTINSADMVDDSTAEVYLTVTSSDGSSSERATLFVLESGLWKHELTQAEYDLFAGATATVSASASASESASASATATPTASASGSPNPSPNPSPDRNAPNFNAPNPNIPAPGGDGGCERPAYPVPPGDDRDGDGDGCAGET